MANHKSAIKKNVRDEKRRMVNKMNRSKMKNLIKSFLKKLEGTEVEEAKALFPQVISRIDHTIRKGTIHINSGSRYKSRLTLRARKAGLVS
jgi:small subunit ribosomal protein S20